MHLFLGKVIIRACVADAQEEYERKEQDETQWTTPLPFYERYACRPSLRSLSLTDTMKHLGKLANIAEGDEAAADTPPGLSEFKWGALGLTEYVTNFTTATTWRSFIAELI